MEPGFLFVSMLTLAGAAGAMSLRNPVHCALATVMAFAGLAAFYLRLGAQFVGLAQLLVYIGAVAILIVFAILLTRGGDVNLRLRWSRAWMAGVGIAVAMSAVLLWVFANTQAFDTPAPSLPEASVRHIGELLMTRYVLPLEIIAVLLTAAMIAAIILAMPNRPRKEGAPHE